MVVSLHGFNEDKITLQKALKIKVNIWNCRNQICFLQFVFGNVLFVIHFHTDAEESWCLLFTCNYAFTVGFINTKILCIMLLYSSRSLPFVLALYKKLGLLYSICTMVYHSTFPDECMMKIKINCVLRKDKDTGCI